MSKPVIRESTSEALDQASAWYQNCRSSHEGCQSLNSVVVDYPAMLLDLTPPGMAGSFWRLVDTKAESIQGEYMTLSHRWQEGKITKLTSETEVVMKQGQPRSSIYQVYQDAMRIADHLGIFQDARLDIKKAAQEMDKVYGNAVCNISALSGSGESIFCNRPNILIDPQSLLVQSKVHGLSFSYSIKDDEILSDTLRYQILSKRGWIYQEQVLAKRTLYFGGSQVLWNCLAGAACEIFPTVTAPNGPGEGGLSFTGLRAVNKAALAAAQNLRVKSSSISHPIALLSQELSKLWDLVISSYSNRDLTFLEDRLLAIAGITRLFADASQDQYLAGLWKSGLPRHLVWSGRDGSCRVASTYRAPSWSWASMDGPITFEPTTPKSVSLARVIDAQVQYDPVNSFDSVSGGFLVLEAPYLEIELPSFKSVLHQILDLSANQQNTAVVFDDQKRKRGPTTLGVAVFIQFIIFRSGGGTFHGIILEPCPNPTAEGKRHRRIGMFKRHFKADAPKIAWFQDILKLVNNPGEHADASFDFGAADMLGNFHIV